MPAPETTDAILAELNGLVGLQPVKQAIARLVAIHQLNAARAVSGDPVIPQPLDLVFIGEPGTGEDVVARLVARLYVSLGLLPEVKVVEVSRAQLVATTAEETRAWVETAVQLALGGVLFVDEAYRLIPPTREDQGDVAITALIAAMGANAGRFAVILAGPTEPMRLIAEHHLAIHGAFEDLIEFPRYLPDELVQIFQREAAKLRIEVPADVLVAVRAHIGEVYAGGQFRSARYVPGLIEEMYARMGARTIKKGEAAQSENRGFEVQDVPEPAAAELGDTGIKVGFSANLTPTEH